MALLSDSPKVAPGRMEVCSPLVQRGQKKEEGLVGSRGIALWQEPQVLGISESIPRRFYRGNWYHYNEVLARQQVCPYGKCSNEQAVLKFEGRWNYFYTKLKHCKDDTTVKHRKMKNYYDPFKSLCSVNLHAGQNDLNRPRSKVFPYLSLKQWRIHSIPILQRKSRSERYILPPFQVIRKMRGGFWQYFGC